MEQNSARKRTLMNPMRLLTIPVIFLILVHTSPAMAGEIIDMTGRTVTVPDNIKRVFAVSPPATFLVYAIDPSAPIGLNFPLMEHEKKYTVGRFHALPVIGGLVGQGRNINQEVLLAAAPDVVILWVTPDVAINSQFQGIFDRMNIPWVNVCLETLDDYPKALLLMGELLKKKDRAEQLRLYAVESLQQVRSAVAKIPDSEKPRIYYAEGMDGLSTERSGSMHADLIEMCGGINVHQGEAFDTYTMEKISMEQVLLYDPDIILVKERGFYDRIFTDPRWKRVKAVHEGRCYLIPHGPFNWFDRPPSFMRLIGAKWLLSLFHPDRYPIDMVLETRTFYRLFLGVDLSEKDAREVLGR